MTESAMAQRQQTRERISRLAHVLDSWLAIPGTRYRVGVDALIGLVPVVGDIAGLALGLWLIWQAREIQAPARLQARMLGNLGLETVVGLVPIIGDLFDFAWRANLRNRALLLTWMDQQDAVERQVPRRSGIQWLLLAVVLVIIALVIIWPSSP